MFFRLTSCSQRLTRGISIPKRSVSTLGLRRFARRQLMERIVSSVSDHILHFPLVLLLHAHTETRRFARWRYCSTWFRGTSHIPSRLVVNILITTCQVSTRLRRTCVLKLSLCTIDHVTGMSSHRRLGRRIDTIVHDGLPLRTERHPQNAWWPLQDSHCPTGGQGLSASLMPRCVTRTYI